MKSLLRVVAAMSFVSLVLVAGRRTSGAQSSPASPLPPGVKAVWDLAQAHRDATPTRERVCINGLWRWQPARDLAEGVPVERWGYFKVPGSWPGITDYMQKDSQTVYADPGWKDSRLGEVTAAWYQREVTVPDRWAGRRFALVADYVNSWADVFVDGKKVGEVRFPGGKVDLTAACRPGGKHVLSLLVVAMPLKSVMLAHADTAAAREAKGSVARRGLCGDVYLVCTPERARVEDVRVRTSVRRWEITFDAALADLVADGRYALRARVTDGGRDVATFASRTFTGKEVIDGRFSFSADWRPERLWDLHTPKHTYSAEIELVRDGDGGTVIDAAWPVRFGFRELWIDGRDFFLNGTRLFLSSVPMDNAQVGAALANYAAARESLERLKGIGINFVYTHNYGCEPGSHLGFEEILRAADDAGVLVALSQPHFSQYEWKAPGADAENAYARHAAFYARVAGSHPSVAFYAMSHNATGYAEDMNPDLLGGASEPRDTWALNNSKLALRAEAIVHRLDPSRIVYHHASGNLGSMHPVNFYANFVPAQEMSDWFGTWATKGIKPLFTCEYAVPFTWDWTMYRGWYKGDREFGSASVPWEFCVAEWDAQFLGDRAYATVGEAERANLRWEAKQFRAGRTWHRWDYPHQVGSTRFDGRFEVIAGYLSDNWRAFRTWGVSANSPWEYGHYWKVRDGVDRGRKDFATDWDALQRPGFSPDYEEQRYERMDLAFERTDWVPTAAAQALVRNNRPLLAYIADGPVAFTGKGHNYHPGETVRKQLVVINNSRRTMAAQCAWSMALPQRQDGEKHLTIATGEQARVPLAFELPATLPPGTYALKASVRFDGDPEVQDDTFAIDVLPAPQPPRAGGDIALFDPEGETRAWLDGTGSRYRQVGADADLSAYHTLIIGRRALTLQGPVPSLTRVRDGLRVVVFEQSSTVLEKRLGFRVVEYGLRQVFRRVLDHPLLAGIADDGTLRDWRGEATLVPPRLAYEMRPRHGPTVQWCDIPVTRAWRCGNRGNVASVLIEKPARGDFRPVLDGGYALQYSPLLEYREGRGMLLFCQLDVTGRTEADAAVRILARNILNYAATWKPSPARSAIYAGEPAGKAHLEAAGFAVTPYEGGAPTGDQVLVVGPGGMQHLARHERAIAAWVQGGGHLLAVGLDATELTRIIPFEVKTKRAEHIATWFERFDSTSPFAGVAPADAHNRDPREMPLVVSSGGDVIGDGVLASGKGANVIFCQLVPWQFAPPPGDGAWTMNAKRTYRRTSFLLTRVLGNLRVEGRTPVLQRFAQPVRPDGSERRWLDGLYLDRPEEWDDPYRFFRW